jgi:hypothetical protein
MSKDQWAQRMQDNGWLWNPAQDGVEAPCLILAHGAGAPMDSPFMNEMAERLAAGGVSVVRTGELAGKLATGLCPGASAGDRQAGGRW